MIDFMESQLEARARLDEEALERTYTELAASVIDERHAPALHLDDLAQADIAIRTCLDSLNVEAGPVPEGTESLDERIEFACRPSSTMFRKVRLQGAWYDEAFGVMLGKLKTGESVAIVPHGLRGYAYHKPGTARPVKINKKTALDLEEAAVLFYKPLPEGARTVGDLMLFIGRIFSLKDYLLILGAALSATAIGLIPAQVSKVAFGTVVPSGQADLVLPLAALLLGIAVSTALIGTVKELIMTSVTAKLHVAVEAAAFSRLLSLPTTFFKRYSSGDLGSRMTSLATLSEILVEIWVGGGLTSVLSLVYVIQVGAYAPSLALPALGVVAAQAAATLLSTNSVMRYERDTLEANAKVSGVETALLNGIQKIKLAGAESRAFAKWGRNYAKYARFAYNRPALLRALTPIIGFIGTLGGILIFYCAGKGGVSTENYMAFSVSFGQVSAAMIALSDTAGRMAQVRPMLELVSPILSETPEAASDKPSVRSLTGGIEVTNLSFRYGKEDPLVLDGLSFNVRPGEYVALVGKSGCGKSTVLRLLLGFEQPQRGTILYGGHDVHDVQKIDLRSLRKHIGVVMQDGKLFMGTIESNISVSTPSATLDDVWEAAEIAGIADDIRKMPMGMQTLVTEGGGGISGGQRQRIMIARAVCCKRRIIMLDEATSALDNKTQKHVADALAELKCTRLVVAHRLSTVRNCDRIIVLDGGKIAEEGSYDELLARGGVFAELVARQLLETELG